MARPHAIVHEFVGMLCIYAEYEIHRKGGVRVYADRRAGYWGVTSHRLRNTPARAVPGRSRTRGRPQHGKADTIRTHHCRVTQHPSHIKDYSEVVSSPG